MNEIELNEIDRPLTPAERALPGSEGVPVVLADGATWLLYPGGLLNSLDRVRDRLYDGVRLRGTVHPDDIREVAVSLLICNYDLGLIEAVGLIDGVPREQILDPVMEAVFGPQEKARHRTYTSWASSALIANGIDPSGVPTRLISEVLDHLVSTKRAIPQDKGIDSDEAARKVGAFQSLLQAQAAEREPKNGPAPIVISGPGAGQPKP